MHADRSSILAQCCAQLSARNSASAAELLRREYPFEPVAAVERKYGELEATRVFTRDGFIDRYSGSRLVFPGTLRLLSLRLPKEFPFHSNWKMSDTHEAFWELSPTVDHLVPVARGGPDTESNWITTSMRRNSAKANWTIEELGWSLHPGGSLSEWDGLIHWFAEQMTQDPELLRNAHLRRWHKAGIAALHANER
jgi:5-methylcytosine-specific restriction endonuclease McrA